MALDIPSYLLGKEKGGGGGGTSDYSQLTNKPSINGVTLSGNKTSEQLGIEASAEITIDVQNISSTDLINEISELITKNVDKIVKIYVTNGTLFLSEGYIMVSNFVNSYTPSASYIGNFGTSYETVTIAGSWNAGRTEFTAESLTASTFTIDKALSVNNTTAYTPTQATHPATKGYVDGLVGDINTILATLTTPSGGGN